MTVPHWTNRARSLVVTLLLLAAVGPVAGCAPRSDAAAHFQIKGGGSALATVKKLTDAFTASHPGVTFDLEDVGSDAGVQLVAEGSIPLGMISRDLKAAERGTVDLLQVGASGTGIIVHKDNPVTQLTHDQVRDIFAGRITTWDQVGGRSEPIRVILREADSSTRSTFEGYAFGGKAAYAADAVEVFELEPMLSAVRGLRGAIGLATTDQRTLTETSVHFLDIDGVAPSVASIRSGAYPIRRPIALTYRDAALPPAVRSFVDFARGTEGQALTASL